MSTETQAKPPYILIVSVILNALLIGVLIGGGVAKRGGKPAGPPASASAFEMVRSFDQALPQEDRRIVRQTFRRAYSESRAEREAIQQARQVLRAALIADPYDSQAVQNAFERLNSAEMTLTNTIQSVLAVEMERLTPQQRKALIRSQDRGRRGQGQRFRQHRD